MPLVFDYDKIFSLSDDKVLYSISHRSIALLLSVATQLGYRARWDVDDTTYDFVESSIGDMYDQIMTPVEESNPMELAIKFGIGSAVSRNGWVNLPLTVLESGNGYITMPVQPTCNVAGEYLNVMNLRYRTMPAWNFDYKFQIKITDYSANVRYLRWGESDAGDGYGGTTLVFRDTMAAGLEFFAQYYAVWTNPETSYGQIVDGAWEIYSL